MSMRNVFVGGLMLAGWLAQASLGAEVGYTGRARVLRVAVVTGGHPFDHTEFFQMFDGLSDIVWTEAVLPAAADIFSPGKADTYDVMVWYCFAQPADAAMQQNIQALLAAGKPLLVLHHVEDTEATLRSIYAMLLPGGHIGLIDLDQEDGSFHDPDQPGIHHHGFDLEWLLERANAAGFVDAETRIIGELDRDGRAYPLFLLTGRRGD